MEMQCMPDFSCHLEIDSALIGNNLASLQKLTPSPIMAVLKNDGYGLTLTRYARLLSGLGVSHFAVGTGTEALMLRDAGIEGEILLLTPALSPGMLATLIEKNICLTVGSLSQAKAILCSAETAGKQPGVHIKIDTGLGRYGFQPNELFPATAELKELSVLGAYTHFACPYTDANFTNRQYRLFLQSADRLRQQGVNTGLLHCCASGAFLRYPQMHLDMVRIGSALLGCVPGAEKYGLHPAVTLSAPVAEIRQYAQSRHIGYRLGIKVKRTSRIGIVSTDFSCGYRINRRWKGLLPSRQYASFSGQSVPVLGYLGINTLAVDLTGVNCRENEFAQFPINPLYCSTSIPRLFLPMDGRHDQYDACLE